MEYGLIIERRIERTWFDTPGGYTASVREAIKWAQVEGVEAVEVRRIHQGYWETPDDDASLAWYARQHDAPNVALRVVKPTPEPEPDLTEILVEIKDILNTARFRPERVDPDGHVRWGLSTHSEMTVSPAQDALLRRILDIPADPEPAVGWYCGDPDCSGAPR